VNDAYFLPFENLLTVLSVPYEDQPAFDAYFDPPRPDQVVHQTFCGTARKKGSSCVSVRPAQCFQDRRRLPAIRFPAFCCFYRATVPSKNTLTTKMIAAPVSICRVPANADAIPAIGP
jgi:hypothetical protein